MDAYRDEGMGDIIVVLSSNSIVNLVYANSPNPKLRLWKLPDFKNLLVTYSLEMILMDEEGCKIHASVKKSLVSQFDSKLEQGQCYYLSNFGVTKWKAKHHVVAHEYRISFYHITKVDNCDDIGGSLFGFDFKPIESIRSQTQPSTVAYGKPSLSNLYNCTRFFINEDIPEIINFKKSVVAIVGTETPEHPIAPLVMSCVIVGTIKCVERETKWYYLGCRASNFEVDPKTEDYKDEEFGLVKKKTVGYILRTNHAVRCLMFCT
nr:nucleic acid-binding, OB-fold, replication protein A, OB domain protein [Tanacetum cinerariifolium]